MLKDDGVTYHQYVTELTYLLFLKMAKETGREEGIPPECRWDVLETLQGLSQFNHYKELLLKLGSSSQSNEGPGEEEEQGQARGDQMITNSTATTTTTGGGSCCGVLELPPPPQLLPRSDMVAMTDSGSFDQAPKRH